MNCKHDWQPEDMKRWTCRKCMATKWIDGKSIVHYTDADGNHMSNEHTVGDKDVLFVERELKKQERNRRTTMNASAKKVAIIALLIALMMLLTGCAGSTDLKYFVYNSWVSGTMEVSEYIGSDTDVKIPDKINGKPVGFLPFTFKDNPTQNLCCTDMAISTVLVGRKNLIVLVSILIFQEILFTGSDLSPLTMQISVFNTPPCAFGKMTFTFAALTA